MKITITRVNDLSEGRLYTEESGYLCDTLEPLDRGLTDDMPLKEIKAKKQVGTTAIPKGTYRVRLMVSPSLKWRPYAQKYGGRFPCLMDVPGFSGVLIHPGNSKKDTRGCILPGVKCAEGKLKESTKAYCDLMDFYIWPAYERGEEIYITIE